MGGVVEGFGGCPGGIWECPARIFGVPPKGGPTHPVPAYHHRPRPLTSTSGSVPEAKIAESSALDWSGLRGGTPKLPQNSNRDPKNPPKIPPNPFRDTKTSPRTPLNPLRTPKTPLKPPKIPFCSYEEFPLGPAPSRPHPLYLRTGSFSTPWCPPSSQSGHASAPSSRSSAPRRSSAHLRLCPAPSRASAGKGTPNVGLGTPQMGVGTQNWGFLG